MLKLLLVFASGCFMFELQWFNDSVINYFFINIIITIERLNVTEKKTQPIKFYYFPT